MANYTSSEIQAAVEKVVRSAIRKPYGSLGNRDTGTTFNDLQDAASGVYILKPNAPFYTTFLGAQRLWDLLDPEMVVLTSLVDAIVNTNRRVTEINNLAPLNNARAALDALSNAAGSRNSIFTDIVDVPAYQRYDANVQRFLNESSKNARSRGALVPTPQEARASLAGLVRDSVSQHTEVVQRVGYLSTAIEDYDSLNLPSLVAQGVMASARTVLENRITELEGLTPRQRLSKIRDVTLDLLVGRASVQGLGSLKATTTFARIEGTGSAFADADHPATPAQLSAELTGPYPIFTGASKLDFTMDSSFTFQVPVPGSFLASIDSTLAEPYVIVVGENDALAISVETSGGTVLTPVVLTAGTRTTEQVALDINTALGVSLIEATSSYQTFRFAGVADLDASGSPSDADFILPAPGTWAALGLREGDLVRVTDTASPNFGSEFQVDPGGISGNTITCSQLSGPVPVDTALEAIEVGISKTLRLHVKPGNELVALQERLAIIFPVDQPQTALEGNLNTVTPVIQAFGYAIGAVVRSRSTLASQVAGDITQSFASQLAGVARLEAGTEFVANVYSGVGRSDPDNPRKLIASKVWTRTDVPAGTLGLVVTLPTAGVVVGDILVVRETPILADQSVQGTVVAVNSTSVTVDMSQAITGGTNLQVEIGPDLSLVLSSEYLEAQVSGDTPQDGLYFMEARGLVAPFEVLLEQPVSFNRGSGGLPAFFTLELGYNRVVFKSTKTNLSTKVRVFNGGFESSADKFFTTLPSEAVGSTQYFLLPENPRSLQLGDVLEIYATVFNSPSQTAEITEMQLSLLLVVVSPPLASDFGSVNMSLAAPVPFARIRLGKKNNYEVFKAALDQWLTLYPNQPAYFVELQRLLNPLIVNENPTAAAVNTAKLHVQQLQAILTRSGAIAANANPDATLEHIIASYVVDPVEDVDVLIDTYLARGAQRGIDFLLQGRFSAFFGTSAEGMSYDGAARLAMREVQRQDLPIRKTGRTENLGSSQTIAEWEDPDFEYDQSDVENFEDVDIPGDFAEVVPPGR